LSQPSSNSAAERTERLWRRIFLGLYFVFTLGTVIYTALSVIMILCGGRAVPVKGPRISERADNLDEVRACHKDLERLLADLHRETFTIQARALRFDIDPAAEWHNWSQSWAMRWRTLDWRCRFSDIRGRGISAEIDKMASVHHDLEELQRSYSQVMDRFIAAYADRLHNLRKDLVSIRAMIDRRQPHANRVPILRSSEQKGDSRTR
jgi:hypothetical protein